MSKKIAIVSLLDGGKVLQSIEIKPGDEPVMVGRSRECALRTPPEGHTVSSRHARMFFKGRNLILEDAGSRNGVFADGRKMTGPVKMSEKGLYTIGGLRLAVEMVDGRGKEKKVGFHRLQYLSGDDYGRKVDIRPKDSPAEGEFTIGLDPASDLRLCDPSVSRNHAVLSLRANGECWIEDKGSRNGTYVNGERLRRERLLKHRDKISIAYFELLFLDRSRPDANPHILGKMIALTLTLAVLAIGYAFLNLTLPEAEQYFKTAHMFAAQEKFEAASQALAEVAKCRDAGTDGVKERFNSLREQVDAWKRTSDGWREVKELLAGKYIRVARPRLAALVSSDNHRGWSWNSEASAKLLPEASFAASAVELSYEMRDKADVAAERIDSREELAGYIKKVDVFLADKDGRLAKAGYLKPVTEYIVRYKEQIAGIIKGLDEVDSVVDTLDPKNLQFEDALNKLRSFEDNRELPQVVRNHAAEIAPTLGKFLAVEEFLRKERDEICNLDFRKVYAMRKRFPLPETEECAVVARLSDIRRWLLDGQNAYMAIAGNIAPMVENLGKLGVKDGDKGVALNFVMKKGNWEQVLAFDCFAARFPRSSRVDPTSVYDEMVGIEHAYANLRSLPKLSKRQTGIVMNFVPKAITAKDVFEQVNAFLAFMNIDGMERFRSGRLGDLYALCGDIIAERDALVEFLRSRAKPSGKRMSRSELLAGYYAEYLSDNPVFPQLQALRSAFGDLQRDVMALYEKYDAELNPEKRIGISKEILATGMPGMEYVRKIWVQSED